MPLRGQSITYNGYVRDSLSGEVLIGANILLNKNTGTVSNKYGFFSIHVPAGAKQLQVSFAGYPSKTLPLNPQEPFLEVVLSPTELKTVVVTPDRAESTQKIAGLIDIPIERLKAIPMAFGETDIIKALAFTPGVSVGNEGTSGLLVRGGSPDQNMILLDDAPLYNQSHLFGFVSTFNADAIKKVDLYKGAFPARFGGRLSSVIDVTMKDGNDKALKKEFTIGLLSSRLFMEGPLLKRQEHKTSFMLSARSSYFTLFLLPTMISYRNGNADSYFNYWLYDLNAKVTHQISKNQSLSLSVFQGHDYWNAWDGGKSERSKFQLDWGNTTSTIKYNYMVNTRLFMNVLGAYTKYQYRTGFTNYLENTTEESLTTLFQVKSSVRDWMVKTRFEYFPHNHWQVYFGTESVLHQYLPSFIKTTFSINENSLARANAAINANEQSIYIENDLRPLQALRLNVGARSVWFNVQNQTYHSLEPRLSLNYSLLHDFSLKASYSQMRQFIHLLSSNTIGVPNDLWVPATKNVKPQSSEQLSVGISKDFPKHHWQLGIEAYHKNFRNLIDFRAGADFLTEFTTSWEDKIEKDGIGKATGFEVFINKTKGWFNGWLAYTYAVNERKFDNINNGQWFRANYDRRHTVSLTGNYDLTKNIRVSGVWQYSSGQPATVPVALVRNPELPRPDFIYDERNNFQTLDYHRLDLAINFTKTTPKHHLRTWSLGIINVYNRKNPLFLNTKLKTKYEGQPPLYKAVGYDSRLSQISFFPILPSVSYSLKFK